MKFTCEKDTLLKEIAIAQEIVAKSGSGLSILSTVLLVAEEKTLSIKATDLKVSFETKIPVAVAVAGSVAVFCDRFLGILKNQPSGEIEFEEKENNVFTIKPLFEETELWMKTLSAADFPEIPSCENETFFDVSQKDFIEMIAQTLFAISHDISRYFMNGVYFEQEEGKLIMVATDGRRLSYIAKQPENAVDFAPVIIPDKVLNLIRKLASGEGNLSLALNEKNAFFSFDNQKLSTALIEGSFPNYRKVIPEKQTKTVTIKREDLNEALKRVSSLVDQKVRRIFLTLENGALVLKSENEVGGGTAKISCDYEGEETAFAMNSLHLTEPLREMRDASLVMEYTDPGKAVTLRSGEPRDFFHIVMPMKTD